MRIWLVMRNGYPELAFTTELDARNQAQKWPDCSVLSAPIYGLDSSNEEELQRGVDKGKTIESHSGAFRP